MAARAARACESAVVEPTSAPAEEQDPAQEQVAVAAEEPVVAATAPAPVGRPRGKAPTSRDEKNHAQPILLPGPVLAARRKAAGLTKQQLADLLGVTQGHLSGLESPRSGVRAKVMALALEQVLTSREGGGEAELARLRVRVAELEAGVSDCR